MLVYGKGEGKSVMGDLPEQPCPACGQKTARTAVCVWNYGHLWYLCSFITKRSYKTICKSCGAVADYAREDARAAGLGDNIPFMKRKGWMICAALVLVIAVIAYQGNLASAERLRSMVEAPQSGDIYMANLAKVPGSGYAAGKAMYGTLLLLDKNDDGRFLVATSNSAWDKKKGLRSNWEDLKYSLGEMENGDPLTMSQKDLAAYLGSDVIYDGKRDEVAKPVERASDTDAEPEAEAVPAPAA